MFCSWNNLIHFLLAYLIFIMQSFDINKSSLMRFSWESMISINWIGIVEADQSKPTLAKRCVPSDRPPMNWRCRGWTSVMRSADYSVARRRQYWRHSMVTSTSIHSLVWWVRRVRESPYFSSVLTWEPPTDWLRTHRSTSTDTHRWGHVWWWRTRVIIF